MESEGSLPSPSQLLATVYRLYALMLELLDAHLGAPMLVDSNEASRLYVLLTDAIDTRVMGLPLELQLELQDWKPFDSLRALSGADGDGWEFIRANYAGLMGKLEAASIRAGDRPDEPSQIVLAAFSGAVDAYARTVAAAKERSLTRAVVETQGRGLAPWQVAEINPVVPTDTRDVFLSHAKADGTWVAELDKGLADAGISTWFDEAEMDWGDDVRSEIDRGLGRSRFGIVVLSESFVGRPWTEAELSALFARQFKGQAQILPIWHEVDHAWVAANYPLLAGKKAMRSSDGVLAIVAAMLSKLEHLREDKPEVPAGQTSVPVAAGPVFRSELLGMANARVFQGIVVGAAPELETTLSAADLQLIEDWAHRYLPGATADLANKLGSRWTISDPAKQSTQSLAWLHPGPVLKVLDVREVRGDPDRGGCVSVPELAAWWKYMLEAIAGLFQRLAVDRVALGLRLETNSTYQDERVRDLCFDPLPSPKKGAEPRGTPSWSYDAGTFIVREISPLLLRRAIEDLCDHFSYRDAESLLISLGL